MKVKTSEATINGVVGGSGPPVLLLHGWPQTHIIWQKIAPVLAKEFTVVCTDLRGYGDSSVPADGDNHAGFSKRAMARDQAEVMRSLGYDRFAVIGHDRGGRVAHRLALDHAERVTKLAVLDIVPTLKFYTTVSKELATAYWHWFFLIQAAPLPETLLLNSAESFLRGRFLTSRAGDGASLIPHAISEATFAEYLRNFKDAARMHAMCEDYRAAASIDLEHDRADLQTKVACPVLALWGAKNPAVATLFDVLATWRERAADVRGKPLPAGHYLPEQAAPEVVQECLPFLRQG
jgi:haloacetate dehalogenase